MSKKSASSPTNAYRGVSAISMASRTVVFAESPGPMRQFIPADGAHVSLPMPRKRFATRASQFSFQIFMLDASSSTIKPSLSAGCVPP